MNDHDSRHKTSVLHLVYLSIIFFVFVVFLIICFCKGRISEDAFQNVSFAATVSSIILAVISIIISLIASNTTSSNLGSMSEVERKLNDSLLRLQAISEVLGRTERKIDTLTIKDNLESSPRNLESSPRKEDAATLSKKGYSLLKVGEKHDEDYVKIEEKAIKKLSTDLDLKDVRTSVNFKTNRNLIFDAKARKDGLEYLIEVKVYKSIDTARHIIKVFYKRCEETLRMYETSSLSIYLILVFPYDNKNEFVWDPLDIHQSGNLNFNIVLFNQSEL